jgi:hypothetical protein
VLVVIYTGMERYVNFTRKNVTEFDRKFVSREDLIPLEIDIKQHFIKLSATAANGFKVIE